MKQSLLSNASWEHLGWEKESDRERNNCVLKHRRELQFPSSIRDLSTEFQRQILIQQCLLHFVIVHQYIEKYSPHPWIGLNCVSQNALQQMRFSSKVRSEIVDEHSLLLCSLDSLSAQENVQKIRDSVEFVDIDKFRSALSIEFAIGIISAIN